MLALFVGSNLIIVAGYAVAAFGAVHVLRGAGKGNTATIGAAVAFFTLCSVTHLTLAYHAWADVPIDRAEMQSWHQVGHLAPQALSIWVVIVGAAVLVRTERPVDAQRATVLAVFVASGILAVLAIFGLYLDVRR